MVDISDFTSLAVIDLSRLNLNAVLQSHGLPWFRHPICFLLLHCSSMLQFSYTGACLQYFDPEIISSLTPLSPTGVHCGTKRLLFSIITFRDLATEWEKVYTPTLAGLSRVSNFSRNFRSVVSDVLRPLRPLPVRLNTFPACQFWACPTNSWNIWCIIRVPGQIHAVFLQVRAFFGSLLDSNISLLSLLVTSLTLWLPFIQVLFNFLHNICLHDRSSLLNHKCVSLNDFVQLHLLSNYCKVCLAMLSISEQLNMLAKGMKNSFTGSLVTKPVPVRHIGPQLSLPINLHPKNARKW